MSSRSSSSKQLRLPLRSRQPPSTKDFRGGHTPRPNDVFIAVMGVTGSGKSSFISLCSGKSVKIGHDLNACTSQVDVYAYDISADRTVYLIDTPGFDDTSRSDTEILSVIATWLGDSYKSQILLHGIIYVHRITDIRLQGSAKKNLVMFRELCGEDALKKVILVTTMWDKVPSAEGIKRETELKDTPKFWGWMLSKGSICLRHNNTETSARDAVHLLAKHKRPIATDLQRQLIDQNLKLDETSAGRELRSEALKEMAKMKKEHEQFQKKMEEARRKHDSEMEEAMREERDRYAEKMRKADADMVAFRSNMEALLTKQAEREAQLERRLERRMEKQQAAHEKELKRLRDEKAKLEREREKEKRDRREQEKEARREQKKQAEQDRKRQIQQSTVSVPALSSNAGTYSPYSVTMTSASYACTGPKSYNSNSKPWPEVKKGSEYIDAVSFGENASGEFPWIARYSRGTWSHAQSLESRYPHLASSIDHFGLNNLEFCILGPGQDYFARWLNGCTRSWGSNETNTLLTKYSTLGDGSKIMAMSFGYGGSVVISYGTNMKALGNWLSLKGYYSDLYQFYDQNRPLSIVAIALNPMSTTDYILVYTKHNGDGLYRVRWLCSDMTIWQSISDWWDKECA